ILFTSLRDAASYTTKSPFLRLDINTCLPSGVNASRLAPNTLASILSTRVFDARSITAMVPSSAAAVQSCLPSGDTSKPSEPRETLITVCTQSCRGCGLDPGGGPACSAPGGGPK